MISEKLLTNKYYYDRLSLFMKNSYGIKEQLTILIELLQTTNSLEDEILDRLNVFGVYKDEDGTYKYHTDYYEKYYDENNKNELLEFIGELFGCHRHIYIPVKNAQQQWVNTVFDLTDEQLLIYIKCQMLKQSFDGTRENLKLLYKYYENRIIQQNSLTNLQFDYVQYTDVDYVAQHATCLIYWNNYDEEFSELDSNGALKALFEYGELTIESMGIDYQRAIAAFLTFGIYATDSESGDENFNKKFWDDDTQKGAIFA